MPIDTAARWHGIPIRYIALMTMSVQNAAAALIMHYSRVMPGYEEKRYMSSTAVFLSEVVKLVCAMIMVRYQHVQEHADYAPSWRATLKTLVTPDAWKLVVPAALYTVQNNLQYLAMSKLDAATFQVTYQLKLLTTALFSVLILRKQLTLARWGALVILTIGVALVSLPTQSAAVVNPLKPIQSMAERQIGLLAVVSACCLSGLAGVYFEKVLKGSNTSIWTLNVQLSFFSMFPALLLGVAVKDGAQVMANGFFFGYNYVVWLSILIQAIGGLIVAICVFYTDNIRKNFATSIAVLLSAVASVFMFDFIITRNFYMGSSAVFLATFIYATGDSPQNKETEYEVARMSEDLEALEFEASTHQGEIK